MLKTFLDSLDKELYTNWVSEANKMVNQLAEGFAKIDFGKDAPEEIEKIKNSILEFEKISNEQDRTEYAKHISIIKENLEKLALNKDFNDLYVNNFILQSRRSANLLMGTLGATDYNKYIEAFLNPTGKTSEKKAEAIPFYIGEKGGEKLAKTLHADFDKNVTSLLKIQVQNLKDPTVITSIDQVPQKTTSLLEQKIGKEKYEATQSKIEISSSDEVSSYLSEKIYGMSFETFYTQVIMMQDTLTKINKLSEKGETSENIDKIRKDLLKKSGFGELDSNGFNYLNNISKILGFANAQELYKNYAILDSPEGYEQFKKIKENFVANSTSNTSQELDVIERIKVETDKEYQRIKDKINTPQMENSATYAMVISSYSSDITESIKWAQRAKSIAQQVANDYLPKNIIGENPGFFKQLSGFAAKTILNRKEFKNYIDSFVMGNATREINLLSHRLQDVAKPINNDWIKMINEQAREKLEERNKIFKESLLSPDGIAAVFANNYLQSTIALSADNVLATQLSPNSAEFIKMEKQFNERKESYNNYIDAFENQANNMIYAKPYDRKNMQKDQLGWFKNLTQQNIAHLNSSIEELESAIKNNREDIERRNASFIGRITRWRDTVASFFKIKTKTMIAYEDQQKIIKSHLEHLEDYKIQRDMERNLLDKASEQITLILKTNDLNIDELYKQLKDNLDDYQTSCNQFINNFQPPFQETDISTKLFSDQQKIKKLDNKINILLKNFLEKLPEQHSLSLKDIENILQRINQANVAKGTLFKIDPMFIIPGDVPVPSFNTHASKLTEIINSKKAVVQKQLLDDITVEVNQYFQENSLDKLTDPFECLSQFALTDLSDEGQATIYQNVHQLTISLLNKPPKELSIQTLQNIYLHLHMGRESTDNEILKTHYQQLIDSFKEKIDAQYSELSNVKFNDLKEILPKLQTNLIFYHSEYEKVKKINESFKNSYESWIYNPLGLIDKDTLKKSQVNETAYKEQQTLFKTEYEKILEKYLSMSKTIFLTLNKEELSPQIEYIKNNLRNIRLTQEESFSKIEDLYEELLKVAEDALAQNDKSAVLEVQTNESFEKLKDKYSELKNFTENLNETLPTFNPIESFEKYNELITEISDLIKTVDNQVNEQINLYEKFKDLERKLGVKLTKDQLEKTKVEFEVNKKHHFNPLQLYANLAKGEPPIKAEWDNKTLGRALIIAIEHNNPHAALLLDRSLTQEPIDIVTLSTVLNLAARKGDTELIKKILKYSDISFNSAQILEAVEESLKAGENEVAQYLILNTDFIPDEKAIEHIASYIKDENSPVSLVTRGWMQTLVRDVDGPLLDKLRNWFSFQHLLIDSLKLEHERIKQNTPPKEDEIQAFQNKIDKIEALNNASSHFVGNFQNPERRDSHLNTWKEEIASRLAAMSVVTEKALQMGEPIEVTPFEIARENLKTYIHNLDGSQEKPTLEQLQEIKLTINELIQSSEDAKELESSLQSSLNELAMLNQSDAIESFLTVCPEKYKQELMSSALIQAIDAGSLQAATSLIKNQAFKGHEEDMMKKLLKIIQERNEGELEKSHTCAYDVAYELLSHAPSNISISDENIIQILKNKFEVSDSSMKPVTRSWGYYDNDLPKLNALRDSFVFAEKAYKELSNDISSTLEPLIQIDPLFALEVDSLERKLSLIEKNINIQFDNIEKLRSLYQQNCDSVVFDNNPRKDGYVENWEAKLNTLKNESEIAIKLCLKEAQDKIKQYSKGKTKGIEKSSRPYIPLREIMKPQEFPLKVETPPPLDTSKKPTPKQ